MLACPAAILRFRPKPLRRRGSRSQSHLQQEYPSLFELYKHLHAHPELSLQEEQSAARVAEELRKAGCEVTTGVGKHGVVGVLRNGAGPTVLVRADMDALPVKEQTGLPYASTVTTKDAQGKDVPVMHACGHDMHMTCLVGTARVLAELRQLLARHAGVDRPAGGGSGRRRAGDAGGRACSRASRVRISAWPCTTMPSWRRARWATRPGYSGANVDSVDILVHGVGGHGAHPHKTKDPVVLAAQIVLALQTIVSREVRPGEPAVVTVGSIHGGTKRNIIPDLVVLQLTVRSYSDEVRQQTLEAIKRIARGQALAAGHSRGPPARGQGGGRCHSGSLQRSGADGTANRGAQGLVWRDQPHSEAALDGRRGLLRVWPRGAEGPHLHVQRGRRQPGRHSRKASGPASRCPPCTRRSGRRCPSRPSRPALPR